MTARIAVTGAGGFVGQRLVRALREAGLAVHPILRSSGRAGTADPDVRVVDLEQPALLAAALDHALAGVSAVVHLAAYVPAQHGDPAVAERCLRVNALGTLALLEAAVRTGVRRVVYTSSGNVYLPQPRAVTESDPLYPSLRAPYYLASKLTGEIYVDHFARAGHVDAAILRVSSVYGPGMAAVGLVPTLAARLRAGEPVRLQDAGRYTADLVHVDDVVAAIQATVTRGAAGAFNVGAGASATSREVAEALCDCLGVGRERIELEPAAGDGPRGFSALDVSRARAELGYAPRDLRAGIASYASSL
jgi:UDP-glucose 4-epimerase